jgi:sugar (pentulose or hexulose) kinase
MMTVVGGGTRSEVLVRILCDVFGQPFRVNPDADSAYGAALLALQSLGGHPESKDAATKERGTSLMSPTQSITAIRRGFAAFRAILSDYRATTTTPRGRLAKAVNGGMMGRIE